MSTHSSTFEIRGWHVLAFMIAFFSIIIAVNVAFSMVALRSFPGEDEKHSYMQGLNFNSTLGDRARQAALGWSATSDIVETARGPALVMHLHDSAGAPLSALHVRGVLRRPATTRDDRPLTFVERDPGAYEASVGDIGAGVWVVRATASAGDRHFDIERRMQWKAP